MEKIIGIFDEQTVYAERFKHYINERKDLGCFAVTFLKEEEISEYCMRKKLTYLVTGEESFHQLNTESLPQDVRIWVLAEKETVMPESEKLRFLFRYQKADEIIRRILLSEDTKEEYIGDIVTVISAESNCLAAEYADKLLLHLSETGKTLFLPWEPFGGYGREKEGEGIGISISELLYLIRKDTQQARQMFSNLPKRYGADFFCGPEYCSDLWQYTAQEMDQLLLCCQEYGGYKQIVFLAGTFHESVISIMNQSKVVYLISSETAYGECRKQEFYRQMKYAGNQGVLSRLTEIVIPGTQEA